MAMPMRMPMPCSGRQQQCGGKGGREAGPGKGPELMTPPVALGKAPEGSHFLLLFISRFCGHPAASVIKAPAT